MNFIEMMFYIWIIMTLYYIFKPRERRHYSRTRTAQVDPGPRPVTPDLTYICENCGMLIHTGHGHTREECEEYKNDPLKPDLSLRRTMMEKTKGRNDPPIRLPYYYKPGTFRNWGAGEALKVES